MSNSLSNGVEPSIEFVARSIPTDDAYYIHFSDHLKDPAFFVVIQGQPHNFHVSVKSPRSEEQNETTGIKTCRLEPGVVLLQTNETLLRRIGGSGQIRVTYDEMLFDASEIKGRLIEIIGDVRLTYAG